MKSLAHSGADGRELEESSTVGGRDSTLLSVDQPAANNDGKRPRRPYSTAYKLEILRQAKGCTTRGEIGDLLRREGLHSSCLSRWRRKFQKGGAAALDPQKPGVKTTVPPVRRVHRPGQRLIKGVLLHHLKVLALELKKTPSTEDVSTASKLGKCVSAKTYYKVFGSYNAALRQAGLPPNTGRRLKKSHLIAQLKELAKELGRRLTKKDIKKASREGKCVSTYAYEKVFGSVSAALQEAQVGGDAYTETELIHQLEALAKELGSIPHTNQIRDASKAGKCASINTFFRKFGSMRNIRRALGVNLDRAKKYSREELKEQLRDLAKKLGQSPSRGQVEAACGRGECASGSVFTREFGGWNKAILAAGLQPRRQPSYTRHQLLQQLRDLVKKLGRTPLASDIAAASKRGECASLTGFAGVFGGFRKALLAAGLKPNNVGRYTRSELLQQLRDLTKKLGKIPVAEDIKKASKARECASLIAFSHAFGSFSKAREEARLSTSSR